MTTGTVGVRKCESLTPQEADEMFFPGPGKGPHKANAFCSTCPFLAECLSEAIELKLKGFWAGTTEDDRKNMEPYHFVRSLMEFMPPEPDRDKRTVYLKVFTSPDYHSWMEEVEPTAAELLALEAVG